MDTAALEAARARWTRVVLELERIRAEVLAAVAVDWESIAGTAYRDLLEAELAGLDRVEQLGRDLLGAYHVHIQTVAAIRLPGDAG